MEHTNIIEREPQVKQAKSFDIQASVNMLRFDLETTGAIRTETMQRVYDEELTYIAEGINKPLRTEFTLRSEEDELVYFDRGMWKPYVGALFTGLEVAKREASEDYRLQFQADRAFIDLEFGFKLKQLQPGESLSWSSPFPEEECERYGEEFIGGICGYQPRRRMGFLYCAHKNKQGDVTLVSQSVDNSDIDAFAAAEAETDIDAMMEAYDSVLSVKNSEDFNAGRRLDKKNVEENAWEAIKKQEDLLSYFFEELITLAHSPDSNVELEKKRLTYGVWAALKDRLDKDSVTPSFSKCIISPSPEFIRYEVASAYRSAVQKGEAMFGCGGTIKGEDALLSADERDVFDMIFEGKGEEDKFGSLTFECPKGHKNRRPRNKLIDNCRTCGTSVKC